MCQILIYIFRGKDISSAFFIGSACIYFAILLLCIIAVYHSFRERVTNMLTARRNKKVLEKEKLEKSTPVPDYIFTPVKGKKVSVIIPNYNYARFIKKRIESVINQTYPIYELIILDDCSTDNSVEVINEIISEIKDIDVKLVINEKNSGNTFAQWQKGMEMAKGDYIWIAEADDYSSPLFLEKAMSGFCNENVVLSFTESSIVDENENITIQHSRDMSRVVFKSLHWDSSYLNNGVDEIKDYLCINNSILNVSAVVWKKDDYSKILEEAKSFKLAGDWYVYCMVLGKGDIAYHKEPLNFYRMHSNTIRSKTKPDDEYQEILRIQELMNEKYDIGIKALRMQRERRDFLGEISEDVRRKKVAFLTSRPFKGSGGHRTIIQNINALVRKGYDCDMYLAYSEGIEKDTPESIIEMLDEDFGGCAAKIIIGKELIGPCDLVFATVYNSAADVAAMECKNKAYFIQDYETLFFPMSDARIEAEDSYYYNLTPVTIGKWLAHMMEEKCKMTSYYFDFCADLNVYKKKDNIKKERAICAVYQPEKPRRCANLLVNTIKEIRKYDKDIKIYLFGSNGKFALSEELDVENLNILSVEELNNLYNRCMAGISISSSNPSRVPFEMMAAGLPVVELDVENNAYDLYKDGCILVKPRPQEMATAVLELVNDTKKRERMSSAAAEYMLDYPLEKGYEQFAEAVEKIIL